MDELELVGLHDDGEHVVLESADGSRFKLRVDEALRAAARRDRPRLELLRAEGGTALPPREIQARIRGGADAEEVAEASGLPVEVVRRFEGPVLAEREFMAAQARGSRLGREPDSPLLGELLLDRLAARGVDPDTVRWDAFRHPGEPWTVTARFTVGEDEREARWHFDHQSRAVTALEDEARWLSETQLDDEPIPRRHLAAVRDVIFDVAAGEAGPVLTPLDEAEDDDAPAAAPHDATAELLAELNEKRGVRQDLEELDEADEAFEGFGPQHTFDFGEHELLGAHPAPSDVDAVQDARVLTLPSADSAASPAQPGPASSDPAAPSGPDQDAATGADAGTPTHDDAAAATSVAPHARTESGTAQAGGDAEVEDGARPRSRSRKGRASVPSWDEIVFGARRD